MLRSKLETRLRGLVAFSVVAVTGALVSGISARNAPPELCTLPQPATPGVIVVSRMEEQTGVTGRQITVVRFSTGRELPEPPSVPVAPQAPAGVVL
jgi:hypothetical protein